MNTARSGHIQRMGMALLAGFLLAGTASGSDTRLIPPPEFTSDYVLPATTAPPPRRVMPEFMDGALLAAALALAAFASLHRRSRRMIVVLAAAGLLYFGFFRRGCVCPIGALQNAAVALTTAGGTLPGLIALYFLLPLVAAVWFGRVFCASVCPLGALQELALVRPQRVPRGLDQGLGLLRHAVLGVAVLLAVTGGAFLICRFDPYVGFFRLSASAALLAFGGAMLLLGTVIGRPYCRYLCPYAVLLRWLAAASKWRLKITPHPCIQCRLCENACPYGAIRKPFSDMEKRTTGRRRLVYMLLLLPVLAFSGGLLGRGVAAGLSMADPTIRTANELRRFDPHGNTPPSERVDAFLIGHRSPEDLFAEAAERQRRIYAGGWGLGIWMGLVIGAKLTMLSVRRTHEAYEADPADCVQCGRCFAACPLNRKPDLVPECPDP